jgi:formylglycine-generating enzyme required for sulfatase activity
MPEPAPPIPSALDSSGFKSAPATKTLIPPRLLSAPPPAYPVPPGPPPSPLASLGTEPSFSPGQWPLQAATEESTSDPAPREDPVATEDAEPLASVPAEESTGDGPRPTPAPEPGPPLDPEPPTDIEDGRVHEATPIPVTPLAQAEQAAVEAAPEERFTPAEREPLPEAAPPAAPEPEALVAPAGAERLDRIAEGGVRAEVSEPPSTPEAIEASPPTPAVVVAQDEPGDRPPPAGPEPGAAPAPDAPSVAMAADFPGPQPAAVEADQPGEAATQAAIQEPEAVAALQRPPERDSVAAPPDFSAAAGESFTDRLADGGAGPEMVWIPVGVFEMGSPAEEGGRFAHEGPPRTVHINRPFALGRYEVTFEEYERFAQATGRPLPDDRGWGRGQRPVIGVSWHDAMAYAEWLSEQTGRLYRLPSEAEWEYAARAGTHTPFHFGETISASYANFNGRRVYGDGERGERRAQPVSVGSFPPNAFGLHDMHGNVEEWVLDCWNPHYLGAPVDGSPWLRGECEYRVLRGGSWWNGPRHLRSASRFRLEADSRYANVGFRVAASAAPGTTATRE